MSYSAHHVFDSSSTTASIYGSLVAPLLARAAGLGVTCGVLTFGGKRSGKTHTVAGVGADPGLAALCVRDACALVGGSEGRTACSVAVVEVMGDKVWDVLGGL